MTNRLVNLVKSDFAQMTPQQIKERFTKALEAVQDYVKTHTGFTTKGWSKAGSARVENAEKLEKLLRTQLAEMAMPLWKIAERERKVQTSIAATQQTSVNEIKKWRAQNADIINTARKTKLLKESVEWKVRGDAINSEEIRMKKLQDEVQKNIKELDAKYDAQLRNEIMPSGLRPKAELFEKQKEAFVKIALKKMILKKTIENYQNVKETELTDEALDRQVEELLHEYGGNFAKDFRADIKSFDDIRNLKTMALRNNGQELFVDYTKTFSKAVERQNDELKAQNRNAAKDAPKADPMKKNK